MKKRNVWRAIAAIAVLYTVRTGLKMAQDARRYNYIRSLSDEGNVQQELPDLIMEVMRRERDTASEWVNFAMTFPRDIARYMKIEGM